MLRRMSGATIVPIESLRPAQLDQVAVQHHNELPSGLAEMGLPMVRRFYASVASSPHLFGVAAIIDDRVSGAVAGSSRPNEAFEGIIKPFPQTILHILQRRPQALPQMVWSKLKPAHAEARPDDSADLMYIFTIAEVRGRGVGRALIEAFIQAGKARGIPTITLSVETDNQSAIRLYDNLGFKLTHPGAREGKYIRQRMALTPA